MFFTLLSIAGAFFPLYGLSFGGIKLTLFRLGVLPLVVLLGSRAFKRLNNILKLLLIFIVLRTFSLLFTDEFSFGLTQIIWFIEGFCFLVIVNYLANKYQGFSVFYTKGLLLLGSIAVLFILAQAVDFFIFGKLLYPPFWQNYANVVSSDLYWNYPIYGLGRIIGTFSEPNMAGTMCAFFFALLLPIYYNNKSHKILYITLIVVTIISSIFTGSRQSLVSMFLTLILFIARFARSNKKMLFRFALGFVIIVITLVIYSDFFSLLEGSENVFTRFQQGSDDEDVSGGRFDLLKKTWDNFGFQHVLFGAGEGSTGGGGHNAFLAIFLENGIFTFFIFLKVLFDMIKKSYKKYIKEAKVIDISAVLIGITWAFLMFVNWAQLNQSISFVYLAFIFISLRGEFSTDKSFIGTTKNIHK